MMSFESRTDNRRKNFKKGIDAEDARRKREDEALSLRKAKKDEQMQKKRMMIPVEDQENVENQCNGATPAPYAQTGMLELHQQLLAPTISAEDRLAVVTDIRKRLSKATAPPTQEACDAGLIPTMVTYLSSEDTKLQFEAAWVLTNIASGESHQTAAVVHANAVPAFAQLLSSNLLETREQAVWAIGNILGDSAELRNYALTFELLPAMLQLVVAAEQSGVEKVGALRNATWALSNVFRGKPGPQLETILPAIPYLGVLLNHADAEVKADTLWAMSYLCDGDTAKIDAFCATGALPLVVQHLGHEDTKIVQPALRAVGNIATGTDVHTEAVVQSGVLHYINALLGRTKGCIRKEAMWLVSNVTAGTKEQIQAVIDAGLLPQIVQTAASDVMDVKKEALWVVANAAVGGSPAQLQALAEAGAVALCASVLDACLDHAALVAVLDGLKAFLIAGQQLENAGQVNVFSTLIEENDGLTKLEQLQEDASAEVYEKAVYLMETFFEAADEEDVDAQNTAASSSGAFDFS